MSELKLPVKFDEDFDLVDADGFPLLWDADMVDHNPDIGVEIAKRVNNHERLKEFVDSLVDFVEINVGDTNLTRQAEEFLAALEAEKGGEL